MLKWHYSVLNRHARLVRFDLLFLRVSLFALKLGAVGLDGEVACKVAVQYWLTVNWANSLPAAWQQLADCITSKSYLLSKLV